MLFAGPMGMWSGFDEADAFGSQLLVLFFHIFEKDGEVVRWIVFSFGRIRDSEISLTAPSRMIGRFLDRLLC